MTEPKPKDLASNMEPVSDLGADVATLLEKLRKAGRPVVITEGGRHSAVLIDADAYHTLLEELSTLRDVHLGLRDAAEGRLTPNDQVKAQLLARYS